MHGANKKKAITLSEYSLLE